MNDEIDRALDGLADAWNRGDAAAYADGFTADADYITFFGQHVHGRKAIEESHRVLFEGPLKGSRMGTDGRRSIRKLADEVALIVADGGTSVDGGEVPPDRESIVTFTAVRDDGRWRFASFQNTRRTMPPGAPR